MSQATAARSICNGAGHHHAFILLFVFGPIGLVSGLSKFHDSLAEVSDPSTPRWPYVINLTREMVPVRRGNLTVSHKTSHSGTIRVGEPPQDFKVVFDTGSGHIVLPASTCTNETCLVHNRFNISESNTGVAINSDGYPVPTGTLCDQLTIGYGTGKVVGEFVHEKVCLGDAAAPGPCVDVQMVMAVEMTNEPFKTFGFDGIFGLAFDSLALTPEFSFFKMLARNDPSVSLQFGVHIADHSSSEHSELTLGGYNHKHLLTPLQWVPVPSRASGFWQVEIRSLRVGGVTLDMCNDGSCRGIVDTGTSHLGVPNNHHNALMSTLLREVDEGTDCRFVEGLTVELVLDGMTLTLFPENYMRPMALPPDVKFGSISGSSGVGVKAPSGGSAVGTVAGADVNASVNVSSNGTDSTSVPLFAPAKTGQKGDDAWKCAPKLMPVHQVANLAKHVFILGEPVLSRYYTVYDWGAAQVGFGYNKREQNQLELRKKQEAKHVGELEYDGEVGDQLFLLQVTVTLRVRAA